MWLGMTAAENRAIRDAAIDIHLHGWYYLGGSGSPDLVKVVKVYGDMFEYISIYNLSHNEGQPSRIQTKIGHDLIAMASATMAKQAAEVRLHKEDWQQEYAAKLEYVIARHDLPEESKQDVDMTQAETEVYATQEAKYRRTNREYEVEDAVREQRQLARQRNSVAKCDNDYWWAFDTAYPAFDSEYFPVLCSICGQPIIERCINGPKGTKQHYECCIAAIDAKSAAERIAKASTETFEMNGKTYNTDLETLGVLRVIIPLAKQANDTSAVQAVMELGQLTGRIIER